MANASKRFTEWQAFWHSRIETFWSLGSVDVSRYLRRGDF